MSGSRSARAAGAHRASEERWLRDHPHPHHAARASSQRPLSPASTSRREDSPLRAGDHTDEAGHGHAGARDLGQAGVLLIGILALVLVGALILGTVARGVSDHGDQQHAADLAALAGARAMRDNYARMFVPATVDGAVNPDHLELADYLGLGRRTAEQTARANGASDTRIGFGSAGAGLAPTRIDIDVEDPIRVAAHREVKAGAHAEAELTLPGDPASTAPANVGEYRGPFAYRDGKPMRPDTAQAYDRMAAAARKEAGIDLIVVSGFRSDAEQAALFAAHPDPKWVAPPGKSLHRLGTELDLGPATAYPWLDANAGRFHFVRRYAWEPWHFGLDINAGSASVGYGTSHYSADRRTSLPAFVPQQYQAALATAAQRWNISATLLAAQIWQESHFNPFARSNAGALGIAQFMPGTASAYGLADPFDATRSIDAQGHLMRDLLRRFGSVPLALAAYNAGPDRVAECGCIPPIPETEAYVAAILALLNGAGDPAGAGIAGLDVRLVQ